MNAATRDAMLSYLTAVINTNARRSQLQADERLLAGEGFMLNVLSILQQLSVKIKPDKVIKEMAYKCHTDIGIHIVANIL